ncbi:hypothetical protein ALC53_07841, partial [Atta colombica]
IVKKLKGYLWREEREKDLKLGKESKKQVSRQRDSDTQDNEKEGRREVKKLIAISIDGHPDDKQKRKDTGRKDVTPMDARDDSYDR